MLSRYFMVEDLMTSCLELLTTFSNSTDSLLFLVKQANQCQDQEFLKHLLPFLNSDFETIPESFPLCIEYLLLFGEEFGFKNQVDDFEPNPFIRPRGDSSEGSFSPSNPMFPTITKGESITVSFSNGKARFKPSTCTTTFGIDIPSNLVFGMEVFGQNHEWKVERV
ncbi:hypothetical protein GEMRC1_000590 [Eukaryota sp. GEM-RC1]